MARSPGTQTAQTAQKTRATAKTQRRRTALLPTSLTLALWRVKRMWRLLLVTQLGMVAAVMLVCVVPLFAQVAGAAGVEGALATNSYANVIFAGLSTNHPSHQIIADGERQLSTVIAQRLQAYHVGSPSSVDVFLQPVALDASVSGHASDSFSLNGFSADDMGQNVRLVQGRLPQPSASGLEIAMTQTTASDLNLTIGSTLPLATTQGSPFPLHVVGIITATHVVSGENFEPFTVPYGPSSGGTTYTGVTATNAVLDSSYDWGLLALQQQFKGPEAIGIWNVNWEYPMDFSHLSESDISAMLSDPQQNNQLLSQTLNGVPNVVNGYADSSVFDTLSNYDRRVIASEIMVYLLLADVIGLVLLFLSLMTNILIDRQEAVIATLRSRGASNRQIFATFATQNLWLSSVALIVGPLLAVPLARLVATLILPADAQKAQSVLAGNPVSVALGVGVFALVPAVIVGIVMLWALRRASGLNVLALRQETARTRRKPLWQRLYLDVLFALLAGGGYSVFALENRLLGAQVSNGGRNLELALTPLALIAPIFLLLAGSLLFLRLFPLLLRLGEWLAARGRGAPIVLALTQLARASRQATRMTLLLALTTAFAVFTLSANATVTQYIEDTAAYQAGADFSGSMITLAAPGTAGLANGTARYEQIPGVVAASLGYRTVSQLVRPTPGVDVGIAAGPFLDGGPGQSAAILAVDPTTFAQTAIWTQQDSSQLLPSLLSLLASHRDDASARDVVYAVVDEDLAQMLSLRPGASFSLPVPGYSTGSMKFIVAAEIPHITSVYAEQAGGMLVDYQSYATVFAHDTGDASGQGTAANFAWLRTRRDAASLASVRAALRSGPLKLHELIPQDPQTSGITFPFTDRLATITSLQNDPLHLDLLGILDLGAVTALLLALFGTLIAAWLTVRNQLTAFALLRALGTEPRRLFTLLLWEQGIVYVVALAVGVVLGAVLAVATQPALPNLIFSSGFGGPIDDGGPAVRLVWPWPALAAALLALALICAVAVSISARVAARPSLSQTLRLNED